MDVDEHLIIYLLNEARHHQSLDYKKPAQVYFGKNVPVDDFINSMDNKIITHTTQVAPQALQQ